MLGTVQLQNVEYGPEGKDTACYSKIPSFMASWHRGAHLSTATLLPSHNSSSFRLSNSSFDSSGFSS